MEQQQTARSQFFAGRAITIVALMVVIVVVAVLAVVNRPSPPGQALVGDEVRTDRTQAVYLNDDRVYFGRLRTASGGWLVLRDAFFLRRGAAGSKQATTKLVPVSQEVGGDGDVILNPDSVVQVQNLKASSEISRTIEDALR